MYAHTSYIPHSSFILLTEVNLHDCFAESRNGLYTVRVENFEVFLISRFSWVADDTKIIHVEGGINTREIF